MPSSGTAAQCPLCGSRSLAVKTHGPLAAPVTTTSQDLRITDAHYGRTAPLARCQACGFIFAHPLPAADLVALYAEMDDEEYEQSGPARLRACRALLRACLDLAPQARSLLDVGAGTGLLCQEADAMGLEAWGVEPSRWAVERAAARGLRVLPGTLPHPDLADRRFDLVTLVDVIEHVADPLALLAQARRHLAPGGLLAVVTPDVGSLAARLLGRRWWHYRLAHVGYFTPATMTQALSRCGLRLVATRYYGWWLPGDYVLERAARYLPLLARLNRHLSDATRQRLAGWQLPVKVDQIIERVYVSPFAQQWFYDLVQGIIRRYGLQIAVERSELTGTVQR